MHDEQAGSNASGKQSFQNEIALTHIRKADDTAIIVRLTRVDLWQEGE